MATPAPAEILLVRHGLPEPDGTKDPPLGEVGLAQARRLAQWLEGERIDAVYSSHFKRAVQTAEPVAAARGLSVTIVEGLREWISDAPSYQQVEQLDHPERAAASTIRGSGSWPPVMGEHPIRSWLTWSAARGGSSSTRGTPRSRASMCIRMVDSSSFPSMRRPTRVDSAEAGTHSCLHNYGIGAGNDRTR